MTSNSSVKQRDKVFCNVRSAIIIFHPCTNHQHEVHEVRGHYGFYATCREATTLQPIFRGKNTTSYMAAILTCIFS